MTWVQVIVLAVVQGLTEFLPISSSGHLVLVPAFLDWRDQGLAFDVAVHFGSLIAVCIYFRRDLAGLVRGGLRFVAMQAPTTESTMAVVIAVGTIPAAVAGLAFAGWIEDHLRDPTVVVATLSGYAVFMVLADRLGRRDRNITQVRMRDAVLIGCAQALALVPGTSRSGVTITAARALGFDRHDAARFSFLLSVPIILMASLYKGVELVLAGNPIPLSKLGAGVLVTALVAYASIDVFMRVVNRIGLLPFAMYRLALAAVIIWALL